MPGRTIRDADHGTMRHPAAAHDADAAAARTATTITRCSGIGYAGLVSLIGPGVLIAAFGLALAIFFAMRGLGEMHAPFVQRYFGWMPVGDLLIDASFQLDQLSMVMVLIITGVGALIHLFSVGYMQDDPGYPRYFAYLNLFVFFMLVLVLGASYPILFIGWEGVGLCSYLLIGYWFSEKANADAGKKAFIVNRIGDFGFLIAMFLLFANIGRLDFVGVTPLADAAPVRRRGGHGDLPLPLPRLRRQERADPALRLAARRDGRPDAGLGAHPCRDDGHGGRLPDRAQQRAVLAGAGGRSHRRAHRRAHRDLRGVDRPEAVGHQEGARVFDRLAARLHVRRRRLGRVRRRHLPPDDARLLQGAALPRLGLGDLRHARGVSRARTATRTRRTCATWAA